MKPLQIILPGLLLLVIFGGCSMNVDIEKAKQELLDTDRAFAAYSVEHGAAKAFRAFLAKDAMQLPAGADPILGNEAIYKSMSEGGGDYVLAWEPQSGDVAQSGEMGWTWGKYTMTFKDSDGVEQKRYGKYLNIWQRQMSGQWLAVVDLGNSSPAPEK